MPSPKKLKTRLHFNRVNMQRGNPRVWTAKTSRACNQAEKIIVVHNGIAILETVFNPDKPQPRAYFVARGVVRYEGNTAIVEV
jgi:hypothetical protein